MPKKSEADLKAILAAQKADALSGEVASRLASERSDAMDYYMGDVSKDMPSVDGRSKAVSTDVSDTIEGLMPSLMDIFCGSDEVVKFEPVGPEDVQAAEQETDFVNHVFMQQNPGFLILYSFIKDALLSKVGIVKVFPEEKEDEEKETYYDQPDDAYAMIMAKEGAEVVEHTEYEDGMGGKLHDVTISCKTKYSRARVEPVPPEEFGIARSARNIRDCSYCFHEVKRAEADLIAEGFDAEQIRKLPSYAIPAKTEESARDTVEESNEGGGDDNLNKAMRQIRVTEHYIRMDYEGDGKARLYRVTTGGEQGDVLKRNGKPDIVEEDMVRFAAMTPVIMTHRFFGRSIADLVMDIQRIKTALLRAVLDNAYLANNARAVVSEDESSENTLDDLLVSRPGGIVRVKRNAQTAVAWQMVPTIGNHVFPLIEYQDQRLEQRTGVTRQGQGIDADALQNQSATAVNQLYSAAQARIKLIARIFAETGIKDLFWLLHATIRKHGKKAETVRLRNQWVEVDPRNWKTRNDMVIDVGLGSGGRAEEFATGTMVLNFQKEALLAGLPIVTPKHVYNTAKRLLKNIEWKDHDAYILDPESPEGQQAAQAAAQRPDPEMAKLQAESQIKTQEMQQNAQLKTHEMQAKAEIEKLQAEADMATNREKVQAEILMAREKHQLEMTRLMAEIERDREKHQQAMEQSAAKVQMEREMGGMKLGAAHEMHGLKMKERETAAKSDD